MTKTPTRLSVTSEPSVPPPPPQAQRNIELKLFLYLSTFSSLCNEYFSQTQSLPKLNTLDLSLVSPRKAHKLTFHFDLKNMGHEYVNCK